MRTWRRVDTGEPEAPWSDDTVLELLGVSTMTIATAGPTDGPHAAPVYFALATDGRLVFFSDPASVHASQAVGPARVAAAIYPASSDWTEIRGLQLHGTVRALPSGPEWDAAWEAYRRKFPFVAGLGEIVERNWLYALEPTWVRLVDDRRGFGSRREWTCGEPA